MADRGGEFSFFWDIHITIRAGIFNSIKSVNTRFGELVYLEELTHFTLIKHWCTGGAIMLRSRGFEKMSQICSSKGYDQILAIWSQRDTSEVRTNLKMMI